MMLLKIGKEAGRVLFTIATSVTAGVVASVVYLFANGFKCLTNHISADISVNVSQLNYTAILQAIEAHSGNIKIPLSIEVADTDLSACSTPIGIGAGIGLGASALFLTINYAQRRAKRQERQITPDRTPLLGKQNTYDV